MKIILSQETYRKMLQIINDFEQQRVTAPTLEEEPYGIEYALESEWKYNPNFGDNRICECGDEYYRHFDTYDSMSAVGCKYCPDCWEFKEKIEI